MMIRATFGDFLVGCKRHPRYLGIKMPRSLCPGCWLVWLMVSADYLRARNYVNIKSLD